TQLDSKLDSGTTLAQVAKDQGKSVDGLIAAMKADLKQKLDQAVSAGRVTQAQETQILKDADQRITNLVNGKLIRPARPEGRFGHRDDFGARPDTGYQGPPAA
ncbi:MAG: hypothetical protein DMF84_31355, partial [Acidobacteria bacterium]